MPERTIDGIGLDEWVRGFGRDAPLGAEAVQALAVHRGLEVTAEEVEEVCSRTFRALRSAARECSKGWSTHRTPAGGHEAEEYPDDE